MSRREPKLLVGDILDSAAKILNYTDGLTFEDFTKDSKTVDAVIRNFEIIGEAANRLPEEFKDSYSEIDCIASEVSVTGSSTITSALIIQLCGLSRKPSCPT